MRRPLFRNLLGVGLMASLFACASAGDEPGTTPRDDDSVPADVARATAALPEAEVLLANQDGVPTFIRGDLARIAQSQADDIAAAEAALRPALSPVLAPFRLAPTDLELRKVNTDENGYRHFRYRQVHDSLDVINGDLVVHVDVKGSVFAVNGAARGDIPATLGKTGIGPSQALAKVQGDARFAGLQAGAPRSVYFIDAEGRMFKAHETIVEGFRGDDPVRDKVYVDASSGDILAAYPQIHHAKNRQVYTANNGTSLPGSLRRSEGQAATSDIDVNAAYDNSGDTYEAYKNFWNRDSFNNAGATLTSSVHYSTNYCNAFWNGSQMVYGDGSGSSCLPLARSMDVAAHELTHAVTQYESGLNYSGESGGLNEAMSDIFGAFAEAWVDGGRTGSLAISADTWKIGEDILPPALRYMNDPAADGVSLDYWTSGAGNVDVHFSSGIGNLAFYLMSQGGTHPRGKSTIQVPAIGMDKAVRIFYKANTDILTSTSNFAAAKAACESAATQLGYDAATLDAVTKAWQAVGVGVTAPPPTTTPLTKGVPVTGISGSTGNQKFYSLAVPAGATNLSFRISGGTGDADMYVRFGSAPTLQTYNCRPYLNGNNETCSFAAPQAGTYHVMLNAYSSYSGASLVGDYSTGGGDDGVTILVDGVPVTGIAGGAGDQKFWKIQTPAGARLVVSITGGTGDADLYTRFGQKPTTSTYICRPYLSGNNETCTVTSTQAGYYYVMLRAYSAYSGVTLRGDY